MSDRVAVRCGWCGWHGSRKHPHARPCPRCGKVVHQSMIGGIYLLAFIDPATGRHARYKHAAHYLGWTSNFHFRIAHHINGSGARLPAVVREAGLDLVVVRTWPGASRVEERRLKNRGSLARQCPLCRASHPHGDAIGPPESFRGLYETLLPARHHPHHPGVPVGA